MKASSSIVNGSASMSFFLVGAGLGYQWIFSKGFVLDLGASVNFVNFESFTINGTQAVPSSAIFSPGLKLGLGYNF